MEIIIKTTAKQVEMENYILAQAIQALKDSEQKRREFEVTVGDLETAEMFREKLIAGYTAAKV